MESIDSIETAAINTNYALRSSKLSILTSSDCFCGCVFFKIDVYCSAENRGLLITYRLSVRKQEVGAIVTLLCCPPLSLVLSVVSLSLSFVVGLKKLLLCLNSGRCIFHRWLPPLFSIGQRK